MSTANSENNSAVKKSGTRARQWAWTIGEIIVLIGIVFVISRNLPKILEHLQQIELIDAVVAATALFIGYLLYAVRWQRLLIHKPKFLVAFQAANIGQMINMWIPSRLGIVARSIILNRRESIPATEVTASVAVERWIELVLQLMALSGALALSTGGLPLPLVVLGMLAILGLLVGILFGVVKYHPRIVETWPRRLARLPRLTEEKAHHVLSTLLAGLAEQVTTRRLLVGFFWSIIMWIFFFEYFNRTIRAVNIDYRPDEMTAIALGALGLLPPSVATKPWTYVAVIVAVFSLFGFETGTVTAYALALVILQALWISGLGLWGWYSHPVISLQEIWPRSKKQPAA